MGKLSKYLSLVIALSSFEKDLYSCDSNIFGQPKNEGVKFATKNNQKRKAKALRKKKKVRR